MTTTVLDGIVIESAESCAAARIHLVMGLSVKSERTGSAVPSCAMKVSKVSSLRIERRSGSTEIGNALRVSPLISDDTSKVMATYATSAAKGSAMARIRKYTARTTHTYRRGISSNEKMRCMQRVYHECSNEKADA